MPGRSRSRSKSPIRRPRSKSKRRSRSPPKYREKASRSSSKSRSRSRSRSKSKSDSNKDIKGRLVYDKVLNKYRFVPAEEMYGYRVNYKGNIKIEDLNLNKSSSGEDAFGGCKKKKNKRHLTKRR